MGGGELVEEDAPEQAREDAHREEEARPARDPARIVEDDAAAGHDAVDMLVVGERRAPGVEHRSHADAGAEVSGINGDGDRGMTSGEDESLWPRPQRH